jgi:subtilisin family serine protease
MFSKVFPKHCSLSKITAAAFLLLFFSAGVVPVSLIFAAEIPASVARNYVIKLRSGNTAVLQSVANGMEQKFAFTGDSEFKNVYSFSSPAGLAFLQETLAGQYEYLEVDQPVVAKAQVEGVSANDPGFTKNAADVDRQWGLAKAQFPAAWEKTKGSTRVIVAVIDTGVDQTHEDLADGRYTRGFNFISDTDITVGSNSDDNGHGTLVAGVIGATPNNDIGIAGTNWHVSIMPIKALKATGTGSSSDIAAALVWAADHGANIVNLSLGGVGFGHDTTLSNAITYAYEKNVLLVAAAGNDVVTTGGNLDASPVFPVCSDNGQNMILGVTASDHNDLKPQFANYGKACIDVSAPGRRILSTINHDPNSGAAAPNAYAYASGTSLAVPLVVGQAALLKALYPGSSNRQLRDRIIGTSDKIDNNNLSQCGGGSCRGLLGAGRINAAASMVGDISGVSLKEGDVVQVKDTGTVYLISGGKKQLLSPFVKSQRFPDTPIQKVTNGDVQKFPEGSYAEPLDGTLVKLEGQGTVYYMSGGLRLPVTYQVFLLRGFKFTDIHTLSYSEVNSWLLGSFLAPPDGSLVRTSKNPTVYWVVSGVLHPVNYNFYINRGLNVFPVAPMSDEDVKSFPKGEAYIL